MRADGRTENAWRAQARLSESTTVYEILSSATTESTSSLTDLDGVAQFVEGGDIYEPDPAAKRGGQGVESS